MITFFSSLGWKDNHTVFVFLELMYRVITRCIIFVLEYKTCGFVREVFFRVGVGGFGCKNQKEWKDKKARSIL